MTRDELIQRYGYKPGERERTEAEMAERTARAKSAEMLAAAARATSDTQNERARSFSSSLEPAVEAPASLTAEWQSYINSKVKRAERRVIEVCMEATGLAIAGQRKALKAEFEAELMKVRAEFLKVQLDGERAKRPRTAPPRQSPTIKENRPSHRRRNWRQSADRKQGSQASNCVT